MKNGDPKRRLDCTIRRSQGSENATTCHRHVQALHEGKSGTEREPSHAGWLVPPTSASDKNPHPILVTKDGSRSSSEQVTDDVLCAECESRFDRLGENYALRYAASERRFRLLEELQVITPSRTMKEWRGYNQADTPEIKRDELAYFALSVFWRAAIHRWPDTDGNKRKDRINLGTENTESLRRFLR